MSHWLIYQSSQKKKEALSQFSKKKKKHNLLVVIGLPEESFVQVGNPCLCIHHVFEYLVTSNVNYQATKSASKVSKC